MDSPKAKRPRIGPPGKERREAAEKRCRERAAQDWPAGLEKEVEKLWEENLSLRDFQEMKETLLLLRLERVEEQNRLLMERIEALEASAQLSK